MVNKRREPTGYKFIKYPYESPYSDIKSVKVEMTLDDQDLTWNDLLDAFGDFIKASGYSPPKGELVWLEENEEVCTKVEKVLYSKK